MLFTIDDRTYRAALEQAQATLARAKTQASLARSEANRTDKLVNTNPVSREEWEQRRAAATQRRPTFAPPRRQSTPRSLTRLHQSDRAYRRPRQPGVDHQR